MGMLRTLLNEVLDSTAFPFSFSYKRMIRQGEWKYVYTFSSPKSRITYEATLHRKEQSEVTMCEISFRVKGGSYTDETGANEIGSILTTIGAIAKEFHQTHGMGIDWYIIIGQSRSSESEMRSTARQRVFLSYVKRAIPSSWKVTADGSGLMIRP